MSTLSDENKRAVYSACVTESAELYKVIVAVATTFLGGGLYYVEKFVDPKSLTIAPYCYPAIILSVGFSFLISCVAASIRSQRLDLSAANETIDPKSDDMKIARLYKSSTRWLNISNVCLVVGMVLVMLLGLLNLFVLKGGTNVK
jgi:hypothetical protein